MDVVIACLLGALFILIIIGLITGIGTCINVVIKALINLADKKD